MVRCVSLQAHVRLLLVALALCLGAAAAGKVNKPQLSKKQPHILLVLVDDWGWGNVGYNAGSGAHPKATTSDEVRTPNIDRLAKKEGLILRRSYVYNFCSPSRAALQTGRYPTHVSVDNAEPISVNPADPIGGWAGAPPKMTGIAEKLRSAGYATAMTGKWDAGMACWSQTPSGRGYSRWFGYYHHAVDYYSETLGMSSTGLVDSCYKAGHKIVDLWNSSKGADGGPETERNGTVYLEEMFLEHSLSVIAAHDARAPLFLFHAFHLMHTPLEVPPAYEAQFAFLKDKPRRLYAAMTHYMDEALGKLAAALEAKDMYKDTLIVVSSDNGGPIYALNDIAGGANNLPLRGGKFSDFEGGIRVNSFVSGGFLPAKRRGQEESRYVHIADWYTTFCALAGVDAHDERAAKVGLPAVDGVDQWPVIAGVTEQPARTEIYISKYALIQDRFKVITGADVGSVVPGGEPGRWVPMAGYWPGWPAAEAEANFATKWRFCDPACLYDIHADPHEYNDLFSHNSSLARDMIRRLNQLNEGFFGPDRGQDDPTACDTFLDKYHGFYGPFIDDRHDRYDIAVQRVLDEGGEQRMAL